MSCGKQGYEFDPVGSCPKAVVDFVQKIINRHSERSPAIDILVRLCTSLDMKSVWTAIQNDGLNEIDYIDILLAFAWNAFYINDENAYVFWRKTNAERLKWLAETRTAVAKLQSLLREGPELESLSVVTCMTMDNWRQLLRGMGVDVVAGAEKTYREYDAEAGLYRISEFQVTSTAQGSLGWQNLELDSVLTHVIDELSEGVPTQTLKKPRDKKAWRAEYLLRITEAVNNAPFRLTDEHVATVARTALRDESISAPLVNRFRWREGGSDMIGAL